MSGINKKDEERQKWAWEDFEKAVSALEGWKVATRNEYATGLPYRLVVAGPSGIRWGFGVLTKTSYRGGFAGLYGSTVLGSATDAKTSVKLKTGHDRIDFTKVMKRLVESDKAEAKALAAKAARKSDVMKRAKALRESAPEAWKARLDTTRESGSGGMIAIAIKFRPQDPSSTPRFKGHKLVKFTIKVRPETDFVEVDNHLVKSEHVWKALETIEAFQDDMHALQTCSPIDDPRSLAYRR